MPSAFYLASLAAFRDELGMVVSALGMIAMGCHFLLYGFRRDLRQRRIDPEDARPVVRSARVDRAIQIACFCLGTVSAVAGVWVLLALIFA